MSSNFTMLKMKRFCEKQQECQFCKIADICPFSSDSVALSNTSAMPVFWHLNQLEKAMNATDRSTMRRHLWNANQWGDSEEDSITKMQIIRYGICRLDGEYEVLSNLHEELLSYVYDQNHLNHKEVWKEVESRVRIWIKEAHHE